MKKLLASSLLVFTDLNRCSEKSSPKEMPALITLEDQVFEIEINSQKHV